MSWDLSVKGSYYWINYVKNTFNDYIMIEVNYSALTSLTLLTVDVIVFVKLAENVTPTGHLLCLAALKRQPV